MGPSLEDLPLERRIRLLRGQRVMLDSDLAEVYGVPTKRLNEQVKRNAGRFPVDFMFRLSAAETLSLERSRSQFATLKRGKNIKYRPCAFTEHGAVMLASVLNTPFAVKASVQVVRAFLWLRSAIAASEPLQRRLDSHEERLCA
ncbi:MAG: ORF6N domain-containing protein, partial [Elusimicrobia bacterium]|nr:ORF6N domain-containing protein [Elusimicrobiota bacterium]